MKPIQFTCECATESLLLWFDHRRRLRRLHCDFNSTGFWVTSIGFIHSFFQLCSSSLQLNEHLPVTLGKFGKDLLCVSHWKRAAFLSSRQSDTMKERVQPEVPLFLLVWQICLVLWPHGLFKSALAEWKGSFYKYSLFLLLNFICPLLFDFDARV